MPGNPITKTRNPDGFTLIELVVVIVVLGILAVNALPKLVDIGQDARIAAVNHLAGAINSAAAMASAKCITTPSTCAPTLEAGPSYVTINGSQSDFRYAYPKSSYGSSYNGIWLWMSGYSGFTKESYVSGSAETVFTKDGAPDKSNCKVVYANKGFANAPITVTPTTSGC